MNFTLAAALEGARRTVPVAISIFAYGIVFGVLSREAGLSLLEAMLMSSLVYAGSAQLTVLGLWVSPLPVAEIIVTTLVVNLRHLLMGAALRPWLPGVPPLKVYGTLFFMNDESWALTMGELSKGRTNLAFLLGSGLMTFLAWTGSTLTGQTLGSVIEEPEQLGLDFAFTAVFIALLAGLWKGRSSILPWVVAALVAVLASRWVEGQWYILLGGIAGSVAGALQRER
jgi:4-azaleucine resistance transporter AzlC